MRARDLTLQADRIARSQGFTQAQWSKAAGRAESGQTVSRVLSKGDCRVSTLLELLSPLGFELRIVRFDEETDSKPG